ncbi:hypothetical protein CANFE04_07930 [Ligilactobacillus animalis]
MLIDLKNNYYEAIKMLTGLKDDELGRIFKFSNKSSTMCCISCMVRGIQQLVFMKTVTTSRC